MFEQVVISPAAEVRAQFHRVKPLKEIRGSAPAPGAASDALVAGICGMETAQYKFIAPEMFAARARRTTAGAAVLPISPASWNSCIPITP